MNAVTAAMPFKEKTNANRPQLIWLPMALQRWSKRNFPFITIMFDFIIIMSDCGGASVSINIYAFRKPIVCAKMADFEFFPIHAQHAAETKTY